MKVNEQQNFLKEEIRCGYKVSTEMKHVWAVELDLIAKLKDVCDRNGLKYYLSGGTLLGAVRHKGFIPWDDDADFLMPRVDFEKLKKIAHYEFDEPYFFQTEESDPDIFLGGFARLRNSNTTNFEYYHMNHNANFGIWIDISILDFLHEDIYKRRKQIKKIRYYQRILYAKTYKEYNKFLEFSTIQWTAYKILALFFSRSRILKQLERSVKCCKDSRYVTSFSYHSDRYLPFLFEKRDYMKSILLDFEWLQLPVPAGYDNVLKLQYGDNYMEYPPIEKRTPNHVGILEYRIPYKSYILNFNRILNDLNNKTIVIFGAGQMLEHYLSHEGKKYPPEFVVDNNKQKWGTKVHNIPVKNPNEILNVPDDNLILIICNIYYREISQQLNKMGVSHYYIYVQEREWLKK
jgi:lipopolysaccharide cholinephosphotransferase